MKRPSWGGDTPLSGLSFDIAIRIFPNSGIVWEIIANTANWISTNLLGMTFGVLFGAALLTLLSLVKKRSFEGSFANAALGAAIGAPLGVCVNCAAPIALGLHAGRMRLETTLAALLASPTLNIIVVTMSFALLPLYLAAIKLALALLMVLVAIPLLCKYVLVTETTGPENDTKKMAEASQPKGVTGWMLRVLSPKDADPAPHNSAESLVWFSRNYARNFLLYIHCDRSNDVSGGVAGCFGCNDHAAGRVDRSIASSEFGSDAACFASGCARYLALSPHRSRWM